MNRLQLIERMERSVGRMEETAAFHFTVGERRFFMVCGEQIVLKPGDILCRENVCGDALYFVDYGLLRHWIPGEEEGISYWFSSDDDFLHTAFQHPDYRIEALLPTSLWRIGRDEIRQLYALNPDIHRMFRTLFENLIRRRTEHELCLMKASAEERYVRFLSDYPHLSSQLPLKYVASYLGIVPQTLSRVRRNLVKKKE